MILIAAFMPDDKLKNGHYPSPQELSQAVVDLFQGPAPGTWALVYAPPEPAGPKRWRVASWAANVRSAPVVTPTNIVGGLKQGDIVTELDVSGAWIKFDRGWVSSSILEVVS